MKKIFLIIFMFLMPFIIVNASSIENVTMDIYLDNDGNAYVTESWISNVNQGTEGYHPYFNLGKSDIELISASMDGEQYTIENNWDISLSLKEKAYKAGIYRINDEVDVCYGLTNYGVHTYQIAYKISNFIIKASDADVIYWTLFPFEFSPSPKQIYIKIHSDFEYANDLPVWGYGNYGGLAYVYDGYIEMYSKENFSTEDYMTILAKFPSNTFNTINSIDKDFNYFLDMANEGATQYKQEKPSLFKRIINFIVGSFSVFHYFIVIIIIYFVVGKNTKTKKFDFGKTGNKVPNDIPNYRDIPCNKDIYRAYFIADNYNLNKKQTDFLGAVLLKWIRIGAVKVEKYEKKVLLKTETLDNIVFDRNPDINEKDKELYNWMYEASKDGKLEANEFKKWCSSNYDKILKWFDEVIYFECDELIKENKIAIQDNNKKFFNSIKYVVDPSLMDEAKQMKGLKNFLKEFSSIKEKEPIEVSLWDEYLIYAQIFGIADEVANQFKKLYPEITEVMASEGFDYNNVTFINYISSTGVSSANSAKARAESYSSGGGGFSSGGGGGGSFGGGGGGGGFR